MSRRKYYKKYRKFPSIKVTLLGIILLGIYLYNRPIQAVALLVFVILALVIKYRIYRNNKPVNINRCRNVKQMLKEYHDCPTQFEHAIGNMFKKQGYKVTVTQAVADGGRDIIMYKNGQKYNVEVKLYSPHNKIGRPLIQKLHSAAITDKAIPVFVTTSSYTNEAIKYAQDIGMELIDGNKLEKMAK